MKTRLLALGLLAAFLPSLPAVEPAPQVKLTPLTDRVRVEIGGQLFTEYIFAGAPRPCCYPILAADGTPLSRDYPQQNRPGEEQDHVHHRSLWFAHGAVNGVDFWAEGAGRGTIVHDALVETTSGGPVGVLRARNRWLAPGGRMVCTDDTMIRFRVLAGGRALDYEVTLHALPDTTLVFGDTKEGAMAMRLAQWMVLPHRSQGREIAGTGHIVTSTGARDGAAWGTRADWVDYYASRDGRTYGVAIFDHPQNPRHPTWWHVREYGLFAANPFGQHDFESLKDRPHAGDFTVPAGGSLTLRYRFYFHLGDADAAKAADRYGEYAAGR